MAGLLCSGNIRIALLSDDGVNSGFVALKNTTELSINSGEANQKNRVSKKIADYGQNIDTVFAPGGPVLTLKVDDVDADTIGWMFRGDVVKAALPALANQAVDVTLSTSLYQRLVPAGYTLGSVSIASVDGETVYVEGTDYSLDDNGFAIALAGGALAAGVPVKATVSAPAVSGNYLKPATRTSLRLEIDGQLKNLANGQLMQVNVYDCQLFPGGAVDFLSGDFAVNELTGSILTVPGKDPWNAWNIG